MVDFSSAVFQNYVRLVQQSNHQTHSHEHPDSEGNNHGTESNFCLSELALRTQEFSSELDRINQVYLERKQDHLRVENFDQKLWIQSTKLLRELKLNTLIQIGKLYEQYQLKLNSLIGSCLLPQGIESVQNEVKQIVKSHECKLVLNQFEQSRFEELHNSLFSWTTHFINQVSEELFDLDWDQLHSTIEGEDFFSILRLYLNRYQGSARSYVISGSKMLSSHPQDSFLAKLIRIRQQEAITNQVNHCASVHYQSLLVLHPLMKKHYFEKGRFKRSNQLPLVDQEILEAWLKQAQSKNLSPSLENQLDWSLTVRNDYLEDEEMKNTMLRRIEQDIEETLLKISRAQSFSVVVRENSLLKSDPISLYFHSQIMGECVDVTLQVLRELNQLYQQEFVNFEYLHSIWEQPGFMIHGALLKN